MPATSIRDLDHQGRRHRRRHAWPLILDSRRHRAAAADHGGDRRWRNGALQAGARRTAFAGASIPTRRFRPTSRPARIRPTARSSTTSSAGPGMATPSSRSSSATGRVIRTYSSRDTRWRRPTSATRRHTGFGRRRCCRPQPGFHRFVWDVHYAPPAGTSAQPGQYPISATPHDTPREPRGPWAIPGQYTVRLTVGGRTYTQPLTIRMDPARARRPPRPSWQST